MLTAVIAFFIGGLVILATTKKNPLSTYRAIFDGTGLNWFFHVGSHKIGIPFTDTRVWFPWDTASRSAMDLQQTLIIVTPLILTGIAVAFAFRCGLFNIGGNGQYTVGAIVGVQFGVWFAGLPGPVHVIIAMAAATLAGALWAGIAGLLKATVGAHEVITTIMLNWIALWVGSYLVGFNGPMQDPRALSAPVTRPVAQSARLDVFWGFPTLQGLHIGFFIALGALVVYWLVLNRTTLGYEVKAVGFNAEAARYGGISVPRNYFLAMAISGAFAGLAGSIDILGWEFNLDLTVVQSVQIGFIGIAVALLGRNNALGIFFAALLFGALLTGTSTRNLDPSVFKPELAGNLTQIIQGLVVLFVGVDLLVLYVWRALRRPFPRRRVES
ncbi:MAG: ABC transporter permease [Actinobacteria bacterium]|nr:MAG: ABC transporter permease [Actinomycetota bacterium]